MEGILHKTLLGGHDADVGVAGDRPEKGEATEGSVVSPSCSNPRTYFAHVLRCALPAIGELASMAIHHILTDATLQFGRCKTRAKTVDIRDGGEYQEKAKTISDLFLRARTGAQTRTIPSTPAGRSLPSPHAPPASAYFALAPSLETLTGLLPHACMHPMLTCAAPYAPPLPAGGRGSCPWSSCAWLPRSVRHWAVPCPPTNTISSYTSGCNA